jgi:hypothetical protein
MKDNLGRSPASGVGPAPSGLSPVSRSQAEPLVPNADIAYPLEAWAFNVGLECSAHPEAQLAIGGAILDLRDLERVLQWACGKLDEETYAQAIEARKGKASD